MDVRTMLIAPLDDETEKDAPATRKPYSALMSDSDSDVKEETDDFTRSTSDNSASSASGVHSTTNKRTPSPPSATGKRKKTPSSVSTPPPAQTRKRRSTGGVAAATSRRLKRDSDIGLLKPLTPSTGVNSSMNASLVFDMVTSLSTNDPGAAIATLRSIVVLGKEYPSNLLYDELLDRILSVDAVAYADAVSIYASLVFVFDKAAACSCAVAYPHAWEPLAAALQDASARPIDDDLWRRNLLVIQFYVYCLTQDLAACRARYSATEPDAWITRTRVFALLLPPQSADAARERHAKSKIRNNLILQAISASLLLWQRVFDSSEHASASVLRHEGEDACFAVLRLMEMLSLCTSQVENVLQRIQAGVVELSRATRIKLAQAIQSPELKVRVATTVMGLTNKSRSKEFEWYESNAMGRVLEAINGGTYECVLSHSMYSHSRTRLYARGGR